MHSQSYHKPFWHQLVYALWLDPQVLYIYMLLLQIQEMVINELERKDVMHNILKNLYFAIKMQIQPQKNSDVQSKYVSVMQCATRPNLYFT